MLKAARLARGLDIAKAASELHVGVSFVEAMEENRFEAFDAPVYAKGFLRKYAAVLGLEPAIIISCYEARSGGPQEPSHIPVTPAAPKARPRWSYRVRLPSRRAIMITLCFLVLLGGGYWYSGYRTDHAPDTAVAARPSDTAEDHAVMQRPATETQAQAAQAEHVVAAIPVAGETSQTPVAAAIPAAIDPAADGITILGVKDAWVEVRAPDGSRLFYDHVRAGELRNVRGEGPWRIYLSDTEAVEVRLGAQLVDVPASKKTGS